MKKIILGVIGLTLSINAASAMNYDAVTSYLTTIQAYENVCVNVDGNKSMIIEYNRILADIKSVSGPTVMSDSMSESLVSGAILSKKVFDRKEEKKFCDIAKKAFAAYEELGNF